MEKNTSSYDVALTLPFKSVREALRAIILTGIIIIAFFPLLGEYGTLLFPLGRDIFFRIIIEVLLLCALLLVALEKRFSLPLSFISLALASYLLIATFSTLFSPQKVFSLWGIIYRSQGLFSLIHYFIFFLILTAVFQRWQEWQRIFLGAFVASIPLTLFTFFEKFVVGSSRVYATLNNPNFFGAYLLLIFFLTFAFFILTTKKNVKIVMGTALFVQLFAIFATYTRGAYLGLFIGGFTFVTFYPGIAPRFKKIAVASAIGIILLYGALVPFRGGPIALIAPNLAHRLFAPADVLTTASSRFTAWNAALQGIKARPLTGYGPENFIIPFDSFYRGNLDHLNFLETWFDRAHNIILDTGAALGIPGIIAYLSIFGAALVTLARIRRHAQTREVKIMAHALLATFVAYFFQNLVNFDTTTSMIYFTGLLAFTVFLKQRIKSATKEEASSDKNSKTNSKPQSKLLVAGCGLLVILYIPLMLYSLKEWNIDFLRANAKLNEAEEFWEAKQYNNAFRLYEEGLSIDAPPVNPHLRYRFTNAILSFAVEFKTRQPELVKERLLKGIELIEENRAREFPYFTRNAMTGGVISNIMLELKEPKEEWKAKADYYFTEALKLSPRRPSTLIEWAKTDFLTGQYAEGKEKLERIILMNDRISEAYFMLGLGSIYQYNLTEAETYFAEANKRGIDMKNPNRLLQLVFVYNEIKDYEKTIEMMEKIIELDPNTIQHYASLATMYKKIGNLQKAKETALRILTIEPEANREVEEFLKQLEQK